MTRKRFQEFDGFVYLGYFRWLFFDQEPCQACGANADGFCVVFGRGRGHLLRLCGSCGQVADASLLKGVQRRIDEAERARFVSANGTPRHVANRLGVSVCVVQEERKIARGSSRPRKISERTRIEILASEGPATEVARACGVSCRTVRRIRSGDR